MGITIKTEGLNKDYVERLRQGEPRLMFEVARDLATELDHQAPTTKVNFRARGLGKNTSVSSSHPGAKVMDVGGFIRPKRGRALKFRDGGYSRHARVKGTRYVRKAMRELPQMIDEAGRRLARRLEGGQ